MTRAPIPITAAIGPEAIFAPALGDALALALVVLSVLVAEVAIDRVLLAFAEVADVAEGAELASDDLADVADEARELFTEVAEEAADEAAEGAAAPVPPVMAKYGE
jgi:hypothetical protein